LREFRWNGADADRAAFGKFGASNDESVFSGHIDSRCIFGNFAIRFGQCHAGASGHFQHTHVAWNRNTADLALVSEQWDRDVAKNIYSWRVTDESTANHGWHCASSIARFFRSRVHEVDTDRDLMSREFVRLGFHKFELWADSMKHPTQELSRARRATPHPERTLQQLRVAAAQCQQCDLWKRATQTVFGKGPPHAAIMLVGEQPGDVEDREGRPFVGPAGRILDLALAEAGIDRSDVYLTNAVKHFKWSAAQRGKRRIHEKPRDSEIRACRPWLDEELAIVKPTVLVCLGATAARSPLGKTSV